MDSTVQCDQCQNRYSTMRLYGNQTLCVDCCPTHGSETSFLGKRPKDKTSRRRVTKNIPKGESKRSLNKTPLGPITYDEHIKTTSRREKYKKWSLMKKYGISLEEYNSMVDASEGKCAICEKEADLVVDHCHTTGEVRGLLCSMCNSGIGFFKDDVFAIANAIKYLNQN